MDAQESVIEMKRDEPAALKEAAMFSRHRPLPVGCVGLTAYISSRWFFLKRDQDFDAAGASV